MKKTKYAKIIYSQCWEDTELLLSALEIKSTDTIVSIISGGCNTLSILAENPETVYAIDINHSQTALLELKFAAIQVLQYDDVLKFAGIKPTNSRISQYHQICSKLTSDTLQFWASNTRYIKRGIIHAGKFEHYLIFFRRYILPFIHSKKTVDQLLNLQDKTDQKEFYNQTWNNRQLQWIFRIFFGKLIMRKYGRAEQMFAYNDRNNIGIEYMKRSERALSEGNVCSNRYLEYILKGNFTKNLPHYLNPDVYRKIKNSKPPIHIKSDLLKFLKSMPSGSIQKFNLSDIFEPLSLEKTNETFKEILRVSSAAARLIFWNNLVSSNVPEELKSFFIRESALIDSLKISDKIFFYANFTIYTVQK